MAKKTRPTFSAPRDKTAPAPASAHWVYRSDAPSPPPAAPPQAKPAVVVPRVVAPVAAAPVAVARATPPDAAVVLASRLLFPIALVTELIVTPLTACCRRKA